MDKHFYDNLIIEQSEADIDNDNAKVAVGAQIDLFKPFKRMFPFYIFHKCVFQRIQLFILNPSVFE